MITDRGLTIIAQAETIKALDTIDNPINAGRRILAVGTSTNGALMCVGISEEGADAIGYGLESYTTKDGTIRFHWAYGHYFDHATEDTHAPAIEQFKKEVQAIVWATDSYLSYADLKFSRREF